MANYLQDSMKETIRTLDKKGWSRRRIARELGINRRTVGKYIASKASNCTISTAGAGIDSKEVTNSKCTISTTGAPGRKSSCLKYHNYIEERIKKELTAQRIYQDLICEKSFPGSYESVKRYVRKISDTCVLPFRRMETEPGMEVQVDYGTGRMVTNSEGKRKKTHLFRIVLSCSRKGYSEVTFTQSADSFIRALENAFRSFGGVPATIVIDNLKAGVLKPCIYDPELNPKLREFANHYDTCILPSKVATPRHKGKVEKSVDYVQNNALKGRDFSSLAEQNEFLLYWEENIADKRIHGTVKEQVCKMFEQEKPYLRPLADSLFPSFEESKRKVHRDGHVEVARSYYSVPPEYVKREVWVRYDMRTVSVFDLRMNKISIHARVEPGKFSTHDYHIPKEKISNPEKGNAWLLKQADSLGGKAGAWARAMLKNRGIPGCRVLNGLLQFADKYTASAINQACGEALEYNTFQLKELKKLISNNYQAEQLQFEFLEEHPLIRKMSEYKLTNIKEVFSCKTN
jgi:transposase